MLYLSLLIREWWANVTKLPDDNSNTVFSKGTDNGSKASTPKGGQFEPNSTAGLSAEWKTYFFCLVYIVETNAYGGFTRDVMDYMKEDLIVSI